MSVCTEIQCCISCYTWLPLKESEAAHQGPFATGTWEYLVCQPHSYISKCRRCNPYSGTIFPTSVCWKKVLSHHSLSSGTLSKSHLEILESWRKRAPQPRCIHLKAPPGFVFQNNNSVVCSRVEKGNWAIEHHLVQWVTEDLLKKSLLLFCAYVGSALSNMTRKALISWFLLTCPNHH